jgi:hypothetical protein
VLVGGGERLRGQHEQRIRHRHDGRDRVVDLMAQHSQQPVEGTRFLGAQGLLDGLDHQQLASLSLAAHRRARHLPAAAGCGKGMRLDTRAGTREQRLQAELCVVHAEQIRSACQQPLTGGIDEAQPAVSGKSHDRAVEARQHFAEQLVAPALERARHLISGPSGT